MTCRHRSTRQATWLLPLLALLAGCIEVPPDSTVTAPADSLAGESSDVAAARYLTYFVFAGTDGQAFFGSFAQETGSTALAREYDAWKADEDGWARLIHIRDTLPTPRAAWRILPGAGLDISVGNAREVVGLSFTTADGPVELHAGEEVAVWTGPTGQRESVGLAALTAGGEPGGGLLFFRRAARALQFASSSAGSRGFLLADSDGNGLFIDVEDESGLAVARTWLHGSLDVWDDVILTADSSAANAAVRRWRFEIPGAGLSGTIRAVASPSDQPVPAFRIECDLLAEGDSFRFVGLSARLELP
jgi:hypothetical protein